MIGQPARLGGAVEFWGFVVFSLGLLHMMRNLSVLYFGVYFGAFALLLFSLINSEALRGKVGLIFGLGFAYFYCICLTIYNMNDFGDPIIGVARLSFILPCVVAVVAAVNSESILKFCSVWLLFVLIAAISLPLQFLIGPIGWFADSFERVGVERFGSLAGSLTTFGNIVGAAFFSILMTYRRPLLAALALACLIVGCLASLQKAAFASVGVALLTVVLAGRLKLATLFALGMGFGSVFALGFYFADAVTRETILIMIETFLGTVDSSKASDVSILQSVNDRIFELPMAAFEYYGSSAVWTGIGVFGGSGGLGYPYLPHTHNLIGETILLFGFIPGLLIVAIIFFFLLKSFVILVNRGKNYDGIDILAAGLFVNITIPSIFAGALFYHPAGGSIFWLSLIYLVIYTNEKGKRSRMNPIINRPFRLAKQLF